MPNESQELLDDARDQLNLVLGFFSRVDAKASVVLAINTGMLAVLASNAPSLHKISVLAGVAAIMTVPIIAASSEPPDRSRARVSCLGSLVPLPASTL